LSVKENINYIGDLRRVPPVEITERGDKYLKLFDMDRFKNRLAAQLSGGMKQKLALVCALVSEPNILLLDEPTTGVDPVSRREFWDTLAHLAGQGLTVLVATPYLDEAERCHRIALIHLGEIRQIGTPDEIRESLHAKRIELRTPAIRKTLKILRGAVAVDLDIFDTQRFGDRLDLLSHEPDVSQKKIEDLLRKDEIPIEDIRVDEPTLENTFVATLRAISHEMKDTPFPARHDHSGKRGQIAIGAQDLTKRFGAFTAVHNVSMQVRYGEIYGLLGANGAGKTTTIKMLCGLLEPTTGTMELAGERDALRSNRIRQQIGYMSQKFSLYNDCRLPRTWTSSAAFTACPPANSKRRNAG
jgi:ABC-2 type transport system ATP-binding protein